MSDSGARPADLKVEVFTGPVGGVRHYGLAFNLIYDQEKALMRLIDLIRRAEKPEDKGFMGPYWG